MTKFYSLSGGKKMVKGHNYEQVVGSRAQVYHNSAYHTKGGLVKSDLKMNKRGRIVSKRKSSSAKRENRLVKAGFGTRKGVFGVVKFGHSSRLGTRRRGSRRRGRGTIKSRRHRGGNGTNYALNPSPYDGKGEGLSNSLGVQFAAGNAS